MTTVSKKGGGYGGPVTILSRFFMSDGQERFVVGFKPEGGYGECAHIFSRAQLDGLPDLTPGDCDFETVVAMNAHATPGVLIACADFENPQDEDRWYLTDGRGNLTECALNKYNALLWAGLVNLYRAGQLTPRSHTEHYMKKTLELSLQINPDPAFDGFRNIRIAEQNGFSSDPTSISDIEVIRMRNFYDTHCPDVKRPRFKDRFKWWCRRVFLGYGINAVDQARDKFVSDYLDYAQKILIATGRVRSFKKD